MKGNSFYFCLFLFVVLVANSAKSSDWKWYGRTSLRNAPISMEWVNKVISEIFKIAFLVAIQKSIEIVLISFLGKIRHSSNSLCFRSFHLSAHIKIRFDKSSVSNCPQDICYLEIVCVLKPSTAVQHKWQT